MQCLKKINENTYSVKDGKFSISIEWKADGTIVLRICIQSFFMNKCKEFDLTNIFKRHKPEVQGSEAGSK